MGAFFGIIEHLICLIDLLEPFLSLFIVWVAVGMILHRQFSIGFADIIFAGIAFHTQDFVVVFVVHKIVFSHRAECKSSTQLDD